MYVVAKINDWQWRTAALCRTLLFDNLSVQCRSIVHCYIALSRSIVLPFRAIFCHIWEWVAQFEDKADGTYPLHQRDSALAIWMGVFVVKLIAEPFAGSICECFFIFGVFLCLFRVNWRWKYIWALELVDRRLNLAGIITTVIAHNKGICPHLLSCYYQNWYKQALADKGHTIKDRLPRFCFSHFAHFIVSTGLTVNNAQLYIYVTCTIFLLNFQLDYQENDTS